MSSGSRPRLVTVGVVVLLLLGCSSETAPTDDGKGGEGAGGATGQGGAAGQGGVTPPCDFDLQNNPSHCGACDRSCAPGQICQAGECLCDPAVTGPDFTSELRPVFQTSCDGTQCHAGSEPKVGLDLFTDPYAALVGVVSFECGAEMRLLVEPGHPQRSYLIDKLTGLEICSGTRMPPPPATALPEPTIRAISDWICAGASP